MRAVVGEPRELEHISTARADPRTRRHHSNATLWVVVCLGALIVRALYLDHFSLWLDEILEVFTISNSWGGMLHDLRSLLYNPPLDYVLRKAAEPLLLSDAARRLPSVLLGTSCVLVFGLLIARRAGRTAGLTAAVLLALAPYHVRYSQEVRPYALGLLLLCLSLVGLEAYLRRPSLSRLILVYLLCLATSYALYLAALMLLLAASALLIEGSFSADTDRRPGARRALRWSSAFGAALIVGYLPWMGVIVKLLRSQPMSVPPSYSWARVTRALSWFGSSASDWAPLGASGILFGVLSF
jgi:uncharacterized membrane protein